MKLISRTAALAWVLALGGANATSGCSNGEPTLVYDNGAPVATEPGSLKLSLQAGSQQVNNVIAVISGKHGFQTQTHNIDVSDGNGVISIFFGGLPEGRGYAIELTAGQCSGTSSFSISADQTTLTNVVLHCPGDDDSHQKDPKETGSVQVTGSFANAGSGAAGCDNITKIVASPSVQDGDGPTTTVELVLHSNVTPLSVAWTTSSTNGAAGTITNLSGATDTQVNFDCTANGTAFVVANVTAPSQAGTCTEQARAAITCTNQGPNLCGNGVIDTTAGETCEGTTVPAGSPAGSTCFQCHVIRCGNNVIEGTEQCDGSVPAGQPAGTTCNASCQLVPPAGGGPVCGNNMIEGTEACDGTAIPAGQPAGTSCLNCHLIRCGNNVIEGTEQCDGTSIPASNPAGTTCNSACQTVPPVTGTGGTGGGAVCGNNVIEGSEECDGTAIPTSAPVGSTCSLSCHVIPPVAAVCGNNIIQAGEECDGTALPTSAPAGSTCLNCHLIRCGNNKIEGTEACDGTSIPTGQPAGTTCSATCTLVPPVVGTQGPCGQCAATPCASQRALVDANLSTTKPVLDCVLGPNWQAGPEAADNICSELDPLTCYCGTLSGTDCANAAPSALNGPCVQQVLAATGCTASSCVAPIYNNPANSNGKAIQYVQCLQDFCYNECFVE